MTRGINRTHWQRRKDLKRSKAKLAPPPPGRPDLDVEKVETSVDLTSKPVVRAEQKAKQAKAERMMACIRKSAEASGPVRTGGRSDAKRGARSSGRQQT